MSKNSVILHFHDFHPGEATKNLINSVINDIYHELPGGSRVRASFSKHDEVIKGMLQINSYGGPFFAVATSDDLNEVTMKLVEQMRRRLEKFKSKRHRRESIKHLSYDEGVA